MQTMLCVSGFENTASDGFTKAFRPICFAGGNDIKMSGPDMMCAAGMDVG